MPATLFAMLGCGALVVFWLQPSARRFVGVSALAYSLFHWLDVAAFFYFWPETRAYWNPAAQIPLSVFGVPAHEVLWALCFGLSWPAMMAFVADVRVISPEGVVKSGEQTLRTAG